MFYLFRILDSLMIIIQCTQKKKVQKNGEIIAWGYFYH
jgi:hypothetical protein